MPFQEQNEAATSNIGGGEAIKGSEEVIMFLSSRYPAIRRYYLSEGRRPSWLEAGVLGSGPSAAKDSLCGFEQVT